MGDLGVCEPLLELNNRPLLRRSGNSLYTWIWRLSEMSVRPLVAFSVVLLGAIGLIDFLIGPGISLSFLYMPSLFLLAWKVPPLALLGVTFLLGLGERYLFGQKGPTSAATAWNVFAQFATYTVFVYCVHYMRILVEHEHRTARHDFLTGLGNVRLWNELAHAELERHRRTEEPFAVVYVDCDDFKDVNDRYGHRRGDDLLVAIAAALRSVTRVSDIVCRLGGDEFVVFIPGCDLDGAQKVGKKLSETIEKVSAEVGLPVTGSLGGVVFTETTSTVDAILRHADQAMYEAKALGRGKMIVKVVTGEGEASVRNAYEPELTLQG